VPDVFIQKLTVSAKAIDVNDHVNNLEYLQWMQDIAIQHSAAQGWPIERYLKAGNCWAVLSHFIEYIRPAFLGDVISILTWVSGMKKGSSPRKYLFERHDDQQVLSTAGTLWGFRRS
jgi:acyl-CoA thioester hydrolase